MRRVERVLRERLKELECERDEMESDRVILRNHFSRRFRWWIELQGKGERPSLAWLIEDDAKTLANLKWWSW